MHRGLLVFAAILLSSNDVFAGRRAFMWTWDTEAVNKGDVEIEQWLWAKTRVLQPNPGAAAWLWFSPIYGLHDNVEIAFPFEIVTNPSAPQQTRMSNFTAEARIRAYDPNDEKRLVRNLIRVFYQQNFSHPENRDFLPFTPWAGGNFVTSIGDIRGSHGTLDVGAYGVLSSRYIMVRQTVGLGYTQRLSDEWRISAEYFHELQFGNAPVIMGPNGQPEHHFFLGPAVAFTRGRIWATLGTLIGLTPDTPRFMPRFLFAIAI